MFVECLRSLFDVALKIHENWYIMSKRCDKGSYKERYNELNKRKTTI